MKEYDAWFIPDFETLQNEIKRINKNNLEIIALSESEVGYTLIVKI